MCLGKRNQRERNAASTLHCSLDSRMQEGYTNDIPKSYKMPTLAHSRVELDVLSHEDSSKSIQKQPVLILGTEGLNE